MTFFGSGLTLNIEVRRGAGGYVCGEETTLINTIEGYRREPRIRPPYPRRVRTMVEAYRHKQR